MTIKTKKVKKKSLQKSAFDLMPQNENAKRILLERAHLLAKGEIHKTKKETLTQYVRFTLGKNQLYGINYEKTEEVISNTLLTPVPYAPFFIAGVINRRGSLITIIDLKKIFQIASIEDEKNQNQYIVIVNSAKKIVGMLVDDIEESDAYNPSLLDPPLLSQVITNEFILGVHQGTTAIINVDTILSDENLRLNAKTEAIK